MNGYRSLNRMYLNIIPGKVSGPAEYLKPSQAFFWILVITAYAGYPSELFTQEMFFAPESDNIVKKKNDTWHLTPEMSHVICDMWHIVGGEDSLKISAL